MQEERGSGRLTPANLRTIRRIAAWGNARAGRRKQAIGMLVIAILTFYLLAALKNFWKKYHYWCLAGTAVLTAVILAWGWYAHGNREEETPSVVEIHDMRSSEGSRAGTKADGGGAFETEGKQEAEDGQFLLENYVEQTEEIPDVAMLSRLNPDCAGWLYLTGTVLSYPVMQHKEDENYYLNRNFYTEYDKKGCLILDNDSSLEETGNNLIIHGHNNADGSLFGSLKKYLKKSYGAEHSLIQLKTAKETRAYQLMSVFRSRVYYEDEDVFKYYTYFGGTAEEFDVFYENVKKSSLYDTGVTAVYGDEFLTLSTCAYHEDNGRLVVVAKRIY